MSASAVPEVEDLTPRADSVVKDEKHYNTDAAATAGRSRKPKRKDESLFEMLRLGVLNHQLGLSINCILLLGFTHILFPSLRASTVGYFWLSHQLGNTSLYEPGAEDLKFVAFCIIVLTGLRAGTMDYILLPWARRVGIANKKKALRFAEQAWLMVYYSIFYTLGLYLYCNSSYRFNLSEMWTHFPTSSMSGPMKFYYLGQFAFWLQQILVVHIEERRKDHWQMLTHHIVTSTLMLTSYGYYQPKVGHVILLLMDAVDLVFPVAKMLKYAGYQTACDIMFGVFVVTWFAARHVAYMMVCWSIHKDVPTVMPQGCYNLATGQKLTSDGGDAVWSNVMHAYNGGDRPVCFNENIRLGFLGLLLFLQAITLMWFAMIVRVVYSVVIGQGAQDSRSDDEDEGEEEEETSPSRVEKQTLPIKSHKEEEVGVEQLRFVKRQSPSASRKKARASGISIPGHTDHKELLGRIGCDKPSGS